ncbi:MAG: hypothetical protein GZ093_19875 [Rhodoferax sp.]|uniref:hypothetical protein n=1 Tax=Rhodoferax sp. TaxID=50421 RepID=UPI0013FF8AB7|nr:hypothetical protein [Rhodoferax sp.]NDP40952.1 hypothetical protein [Rhodoferax sp.]
MNTLVAAAAAEAAAATPSTYAFSFRHPSMPVPPLIAWCFAMDLLRQLAACWLGYSGEGVCSGCCDSRKVSKLLRWRIS